MLSIAILALLSPIAARPPQPVAAKPVCQNADVTTVKRGLPLRAHPLTAEPPAKQILTVLRTVDGCSKPVVVREDVGAPQR